MLDLTKSVVSDNDDKKVFEKRISAFFNSLSVSTGVLPAVIKNGERNEYIHNERVGKGHNDFSHVNCLGSFKVMFSLVKTRFV